MRARLRHRPRRLAALTAASGLIAASALVLGSAPAFADETPPPAESAPVDSAPIESAPVETDPTAPAPVESAPADPAPTGGGTPSPEAAPVPAAAPATITLNTPTVVQYGENIDFVVTVTDANGDPAEGTVTFTAFGGVFIPAPVRVVAGLATTPLGSTTGAGPRYDYFEPQTFDWKAQFTPDDPSVVGPAEASSTITIVPQETSSTIMSSPLASAFVGRAWDVYVIVDKTVSTSNGAFPTPPASGIVDLYADGQLVASGTADGGYVRLEFVPTTEGVLELTAEYRGDNLYAPSTAAATTLTVTLPPADDTTTGPASLAETGAEPQSLAGTALAVLLGGGALSAVAACLRRRRA